MVAVELAGGTMVKPATCGGLTAESWKCEFFDLAKKITCEGRWDGMFALGFIENGVSRKN